MAFTFGPIVIDRILQAVAEDFSGNLLYRLTQLQDATIDTTSETKDATDNQGVLIKRFYTNKSVEFTATNTMLDLDVLGVTTGSGKQVASSKTPIEMPRMMVVDNSNPTVTLPETPVAGTAKVCAINTNGTLGTQYTAGSSASDTAFLLAGTTLTLPTDSGATQFLIKYDYKSNTGVKVAQDADKFPSTIKLTLSVLCVDPCSADTLRHAYIIFPSFQVSPDTSVSLTTDSAFEFKGAAQVDYCSPNKNLYYIVMSESDLVE